MDARPLPAAVLAAAGDRRGGALEVAATAVDGLLEVAADPPLLEEAVAVLLAGQPAMAPIWHLADAAAAPDPPSALAVLRHHLATDADAAVATATTWLLDHLAATPGTVATVSHSSLVTRVLSHPALTHQVSGAPSVAVVGADAIGPGALLNAVGTRELAERLPTLVVATAVKLVPGEVFERLGGTGFEVVPLAAVAAVVVGGEVLSPAETGRRAAGLDREQGCLRRGRP
ncbi:MAG TPA: hypothetical protein VFQ04_08300 [Actinomycetes bacterium]|nr:hypothetical protein [Actinomycetes bacterium]